jgi:hypothetical protein
MACAVRTLPQLTAISRCDPPEEHVSCDALRPPGLPAPLERCARWHANIVPSWSRAINRPPSIKVGRGAPAHGQKHDRPRALRSTYPSLSSNDVRRWLSGCRPPSSFRASVALWSVFLSSYVLAPCDSDDSKAVTSFCFLQPCGQHTNGLRPCLPICASLRS